MESNISRAQAAIVKALESPIANANYIYKGFVPAYSSVKGEFETGFNLFVLSVNLGFFKAIERASQILCRGNASLDLSVDFVTENISAIAYKAKFVPTEFTTKYKILPNILEGYESTGEGINLLSTKLGPQGCEMFCMLNNKDYALTLPAYTIPEIIATCESLMYYEASQENAMNM